MPFFFKTNCIMKKRAILFTLVAAASYTILSSNATGPALASSENRTGAKSTTANCAAGCHNNTFAAPQPTINIRVDTAGGLEVTKYTPGKTYTVTVSGSHATLNRFGLQYAAVSGTGSSQVLAGSFSGLPAGIAQRTPGGLAILEQTSAITGGLSFTRSFTWTAPATNVGSVTMYLTVNAVNGDFNTSGDVSANINKVLTPYSPTSITNVVNDINVAAFPNPLTNMLNISVANSINASELHIFDLQGRELVNTTINHSTTINTLSWPAGVYSIVVSGAGGRKTLQIVKQ